jgi:putative membrane protein
MFMHHGMELGLPFMALGSIFWLVLLGLLVATLVRWLGGPRYRSPLPFQQPVAQPFSPQPQPSALEILRRRYAAGEIDAATFDQMRERLEASEPRPGNDYPRG